MKGTPFCSSRFWSNGLLTPTYVSSLSLVHISGGSCFFLLARSQTLRGAGVVVVSLVEPALRGSPARRCFCTANKGISLPVWAPVGSRVRAAVGLGPPRAATGLPFRCRHIPRRCPRHCLGAQGANCPQRAGLNRPRPTAPTTSSLFSVTGTSRRARGGLGPARRVAPLRHRAAWRRRDGAWQGAGPGRRHGHGRARHYTGTATLGWTDITRGSRRLGYAGLRWARDYPGGDRRPPSGRSVGTCSACRGHGCSDAIRAVPLRTQA